MSTPEVPRYHDRKDKPAELFIEAVVQITETIEQCLRAILPRIKKADETEKRNNTPGS